MDPLSITTGVLALIGTCVTIGTTIKTFIEKTKSTKPLLLQLLNRIEHIRIHLANLRSLSARLVGPQARDIVIPFDYAACEGTLKRLEVLVNKIVDAGNAGKVKVAISWLMDKSIAEDLLQALESDERSIMIAMSSVAALSSVVTKETVDVMIASTEKLAVVDNPFKEDSTHEKEELLQEDFASAPPAYRLQPPNRDMQIWLGQITRDELPRDYRVARDELSDAAYVGDWDLVFSIVDEGVRQYREQWINGSRLKPSAQFRQISRWTPLHQAAFLGAPIDVVQQMLDRGAYRTLRTAWTNENEGLAYRDQTAAEIAQDMGYHEIYAALCPIIRHPVPADVLARLQDQLHTLLRTIINDSILAAVLWLPELSVLTELEAPLLRFPVYRSGNLQWSFQVMLDGRELIVRALRYFAGGADEEYFRITDRSTYSIEEPVVSIS